MAPIDPLKFAEMMGIAPALLQKQVTDVLESERRRMGIAGLHARDTFGQLQDATAAPMPEPPPLAAGIEQLAGDVGSIFSRRPEFGDRARQNVQQQRALLIQQRQENLGLLRERYLQQAEAAKTIDPIKEIELREKAERLSKLLQEQGDTARIQTQTESAEKVGAAHDKAMKEASAADNATSIRVAEINNLGELMRWLASNSGGATMSEDDYNKRRNEILNTFQSDKSKGVAKESQPLVLAGLLTLKKPGDTELSWGRRAVSDWMAVTRNKRLTSAGQALIQSKRLELFPPDSTAAPAPPPKPKAARKQSRIEIMIRKEAGDVSEDMVEKIMGLRRALLNENKWKGPND